MAGRQNWKTSASALGAHGPVPALIEAPEIPDGCSCEWRPADSRVTGPAFRGWVLKFVNRSCPVLRRHGDGYGR